MFLLPASYTLSFPNFWFAPSTYLLFILCWVQTLKEEIARKGGSTTFPFLSTKKLGKFLIPLPPMEEQQRIVDRVNELMVKIDEYKKVEKELIALEQRFPDDMKNALLQAAMQGKLTEQLDCDSSVDEMLEAIKEAAYKRKEN